MTEFRGLEAFDEVKRLIIVAAHPDDIETMCGGTIAWLVQRGVKIFSVTCTLGDIGSEDPTVNRLSLGQTRLAETKEAAQILGIEQTFNLGYPDGELVAHLELRARIAWLYRQTQADTLLTFDPFWSGQLHPDHREAGQAALDAYIPAKMPLYHPEQLTDEIRPACLERAFLFLTDLDVDIYIDVKPVYETKLAACMAHASQFPDGEESLAWLKELDQARGKAANLAYAESFRQMQVW